MRKGLAMITITHEKANSCEPEGFQNDTANDLNFPTGQRERKAFLTLFSRFSLAGYALHRTDPRDGPVSYYAERRGLVRCLPSLNDAQRLLNRLEGSP